MNTSPTKEQMEYTQNNLFQIAKIALVQRKFQVALDNAEKGLYNVARSTLPLDPDNMCGKISLRHTTCGKYGTHKQGGCIKDLFSQELKDFLNNTPDTDYQKIKIVNTLLK